jgi:DNA-binding response OmpR family regulator
MTLPELPAMHVLIVEDSDTVRRMLEIAVERAGYSVTSVSDGIAAWETYQRLRPAVVLLDWQIPGMDGLEVCRRIREHQSSCQTFVLMITARETGEDLAAALAVGVDDYLTKPVGPAHLRARLQIAKLRIAQRAERWKLDQELSHARWLAGIGETTLALQHELNNPLFALLGHAELFANDPGSSPQQREDIAVIVEQARRVSAVVKRLAMLREPRSVTYVDKTRMLDLSEGAEARAAS